MTGGQVTAGDILAELDRMVLRCRRGHYLIEDIDHEWAHGVEDALVQFRSVVRSQAFARLVRRRKETPTNAH